jgi:hypothetical protein
MSRYLGTYDVRFRRFGRLPSKLEKIIDKFIDFDWLYSRMQTFREPTSGRVHRLSNAYNLDEAALSKEKFFD